MFLRINLLIFYRFEDSLYEKLCALYIHCMLMYVYTYDKINCKRACYKAEVTNCI